MLSSLQITGSGKTVGLTFALPAEFLDVLNGIAGPRHAPKRAVIDATADSQATVINAVSARRRVTVPRGSPDRFARRRIRRLPRRPRGGCCGRSDSERREGAQLELQADGAQRFEGRFRFSGRPEDRAVDGTRSHEPRAQGAPQFSRRRGGGSPAPPLRGRSRERLTSLNSANHPNPQPKTAIPHCYHFESVRKSSYSVRRAPQSVATAAPCVTRTPPSLARRARAALARAARLMQSTKSSSATAARLVPVQTQRDKRTSARGCRTKCRR